MPPGSRLDERILSIAFPRPPTHPVILIRFWVRCQARVPCGKLCLSRCAPGLKPNRLRGYPWSRCWDWSSL